jgi:hypothetical protein
MITEQNSNESSVKEESKVAAIETIDEAAVLKMEIDPEKITNGDIDRYEKLMKGSTIFGRSNAPFQMGSKNKENFVRHQWDFSDSKQADGAGPL